MLELMADLPSRRAALSWSPAEMVRGHELIIVEFAREGCLTGWGALGVQGPACSPVRTEIDTRTHDAGRDMAFFSAQDDRVYRRPRSRRCAGAEDALCRRTKIFLRTT